MQGGASRGTGFGQSQRSVVELEDGEQVSAARFYRSGFPMEAACDFQVEDEPEIVVEADRDLLAEAAYFGDGAIVRGRKRRAGGA